MKNIYLPYTWIFLILAYSTYPEELRISANKINSLIFESELVYKKPHNKFVLKNENAINPLISSDSKTIKKYFSEFKKKNLSPHLFKFQSTWLNGNKIIELDGKKSLIPFFDINGNKTRFLIFTLWEHQNNQLVFDKILPYLTTHYYGWIKEITFKIFKNEVFIFVKHNVGGMEDYIANRISVYKYSRLSSNIKRLIRFGQGFLSN